MTNSRDKGKRGERQVASLLRMQGFEDARRGQQFSGANGDADVVGLQGVHIEVKYREKGHGQVYDWLAQAKADCGANMPTVWHRKNNYEWLVTLRATDFLDLYTLVQEEYK